mgnify:CR=1 FL=1
MVVLAMPIFAVEASVRTPTPVSGITPVSPPSVPVRIACDGKWQWHLQGVALSDKNPNAIFWSMATELVKTDLDGSIDSQIAMPMHSGDLCISGGMVYVVVNKTNCWNGGGDPDNWVYVYNEDDISAGTVAEYHLVDPDGRQEIPGGAGAIARDDDYFYISGGLLPGSVKYKIYRYAVDFDTPAEVYIDTGSIPPISGIQCLALDSSSGWILCGMYGAQAMYVSRTGEYGGALRSGSCAYGVMNWSGSVYARGRLSGSTGKFTAYLSFFDMLLPPAPVSAERDSSAVNSTETLPDGYRPPAGSVDSSPSLSGY